MRWDSDAIVHLRAAGGFSAARPFEHGASGASQAQPAPGTRDWAMAPRSRPTGPQFHVRFSRQHSCTRPLGRHSSPDCALLHAMESPLTTTSPTVDDAARTAAARPAWTRPSPARRQWLWHCTAAVKPGARVAAARRWYGRCLSLAATVPPPASMRGQDPRHGIIRRAQPGSDVIKLHIHVEIPPPG